MQKQIIITISPSGESTVETKGYTGASCKDASKFLESTLGSVQAETLKPEYHQRSDTTNQTKNRA